MRGIYYIDPEDTEFKETIKNARQKLETSVAPAVPSKSVFWKLLEAGESTRLRMGESLPNHHEDHIAGKGDNSLQHYDLVHKFIPMPQAIKIPAAKAAKDKECEKLEKILVWNLTKVKSKKEVIDEARTSGATIHFASLMDICHLLLLRRLRLPLPLIVRSCRCGQPLDSCGHHRAACAQAGVLGRRGWALESVVARVCREAGGRVTTNVMLRDRFA